MNTYYNIFKEKETEELSYIIDDSKKTITDAKLAYKKLLGERNFTLDNDKSLKLEDSINHDIQEIRSLNYIDILGLEYSENDSGKILTVGKKYRRTNIVGMIISIFLLLFLFSSLTSLANIFINGFDIKLLTSFIITGIIGISGFVFFVKTVSRLISLKGFLIQKTADNVIIKYREENIKKEITASPDTCPDIIFSETSAKIIFNDGEQIHDILNFSNIETVYHKETLQAIIDKFKGSI